MIRIKVLTEKKNPILKRTDLMLMVDHTAQPTPKTDDIIKKIAEKFKTSPEKVEVVYIFSQKGIARSRVKARIWKEKTPVKKVKKKEEVKREEPKELEEERVEEKPEKEKPEMKKPEKVEDTKPGEEPEEKKEEPKGEEKK